MAALALPESPPGVGSIGCSTDPSRPALSFANDGDLVTRTSSPTRLTTSLTTPPLTPPHKSAFRASPIESQHVVEQHTANIRKTVHFDDSFKKTRLFLPADAPLALAASKPSLTAWEADSTGRTCNFPFQLGCKKRFCLINPSFDIPLPWQPIRLQSLALPSSVDEIRGTVVVHSLAFQKDISARFTLDNWKTVSDVTAEHCQSIYLGNSIVSDLFSFTIDRKNLPLSTGHHLLHVCVRCRVFDLEFWDNNGGMDYEVSLTA